MVQCGTAYQYISAVWAPTGADPSFSYFSPVNFCPLKFLLFVSEECFLHVLLVEVSSVFIFPPEISASYIFE